MRRVLLVTLLPLLAAGSAAVLLVLAALAQAPSAPLPDESAITVGIAERKLSASVTVSAGWTRIGAWPFLSEDRATVVAPDGVYRVEVALVARAREGVADVAGTSAAEALGKELRGRLDGAAWSRESLVGGNQARYASFPDGDTAVTVVLVDPPAGGGSERETEGARLVLVASAPVDDARRYRTVTADLVASARFAAAEQAPRPSSEAQP